MFLWSAIKGFFSTIFCDEKTTSSSQSSTYINYGGDIVLEPPFAFENSTMFNFFFETEKNILQKLLDERLNFPTNSHYRYEPYIAEVMLTFANTVKSVSIAQAADGFVPEQEMLIWVPALEYKKVLGSWKPNRFVMFVPYIVVNNVFSMVAGREVFGFPKALGTFDMPTSAPEANHFKMEAVGFQNYAPDAALGTFPLLDISKPLTNEQEHTHWKDSKEGFAFIKETLLNGKEAIKDLPIRLCLHELDDLLHMQFPWVFLKQFRSIENSYSADYQAIAEAPVHIKKFHGGGLLLGDYTLTIDNFASFPIAQDLGIESGQKPRIAFWLETDFEAPCGQILWK